MYVYPQVRECVEDGVLEATGRYTGPRGHQPPDDYSWPPWMLSGLESESTWLDLRNNRCVGEYYAL